MGSASNYFDAGQTVGLDFTHVRQVDAKPSASAFDSGNIIFDRTEGKFYRTDGTSWSVISASAVADVVWTSGLSGVPTALVNGPGNASGVATLNASSDVVEAPANLPRVTSVAALEALAAGRYNAIYLDAAGRSGWFKWDASNLSTEVTNDPGNGVYVPPDSDSTGASGAWVRVRSTEGVMLDWYAPDATGATACDTEFNNAKMFAEFARETLIITGGTYALEDSATKTIRFDLHSWRGVGHPIIDVSSRTTATPAFQVLNSVSGLVTGGENVLTTGHTIEGIVFELSATSGAISFQMGATSGQEASTPSTYYCILPHFKHCSFRKGNPVFVVGSHTWGWNIEHCTFYQVTGDIVRVESGITDSGENMNFKNCRVNNSTSGLFGLQLGSWMFHQCSFDYNNGTNAYTAQFYATGAETNVFLSQCHIEDDESKYWFHTVAGATVVVRDSWLVINGTPSIEKVFIEDNGSLVKFVDSPIIVGTGYSPEFLVSHGNSTTHAFVIDGRAFYQPSSGTPWPSERMNYVPDPSFESGSLGSWWTTSGTAPTVVASNARTGSNSLKFDLGVSGTSKILSPQLPVSYGDSLLWSASYNIPSALSGDVFSARCLMYDGNDNLLGAIAPDANTVGSSATSGYTQLVPTSRNVFGASARYVQLEIGITGGTGTVYVDDVRFWRG